MFMQSQKVAAHWFTLQRPSCGEPRADLKARRTRSWETLNPHGWQEPTAWAITSAAHHHQQGPGMLRWGQEFSPAFPAGT